MIGLIKSILKTILPSPVWTWLRAQWKGYEYSPPVGWVRFGHLRRLTPISRTWGFDRGGAIGRYYIEQFVARNANDIRGRVLEVGDDYSTRKFGNGKVTHRGVLDIDKTNPKATIVADLMVGDSLPSDTYDCIIFTQILHVLDDPSLAVNTLYRILRAGGVLLATLPGISQVRPSDWGGYWCGGYRSARLMFSKVFIAQNVEIRTHGNVLVAIAFLHGLGVGELRQEELDYNDPDFEVNITVRAVKPIAYLN